MPSLFPLIIHWLMFHHAIYFINSFTITLTQLHIEIYGIQHIEIYANATHTTYILMKYVMLLSQLMGNRWKH